MLLSQMIIRLWLLCFLKSKELCLIFWSSVTTNNTMVCTTKCFAFHLDVFLCPWLFSSVSYVLADISVTLWCLLWYQTSVSRHPNYTFFFFSCLSSANRTNWFLLFWKWDIKIALVFWFMASTAPWFTQMFQHAMAPLKLLHQPSILFPFLPRRTDYAL